MKNKEFLTIPELARILGISRIAAYKKVKKGQIQAAKIGHDYAVPKKIVANILGETLSDDDKKEISRAVKKTVKEYGEVLKLLGKE